MIELKSMSPPADWQPAVTLDLESASARAFLDAGKKFDAWAAENPPTLEWETGWSKVTPYMAEDLLKRVSGNRKISFEVVKSYARAMTGGDWVLTGESAVIDDNGKVRDVVHRAWASYLSGGSFSVLMAVGVPMVPGLSAYINSGRSRTAADALYMAGLNGLSTTVAAAIAIAHRYENQAFGVIGAPRIIPLTNPQVVDYCKAHPGLRDAAHMMASNHSNATKVIGNKGVAMFVAWKILDLFGLDALERFMTPLSNGANLSEDDPVLALRTRLLSDGNDSNLNTARRLGLVIKGFNMQRLGERVRLNGRGAGFSLRDNEPFPQFEEAASTALAAE